MRPGAGNVPSSKRVLEVRVNARRRHARTTAVRQTGRERLTFSCLGRTESLANDGNKLFCRGAAFGLNRGKIIAAVQRPSSASSPRLPPPPLPTHSPPSPPAAMPGLQFLSLYRKILRLHQTKLPELHRAIGDRVSFNQALHQNGHLLNASQILLSQTRHRLTRMPSRSILPSMLDRSFAPTSASRRRKKSSLWRNGPSTPGTSSRKQYVSCITSALLFLQFSYDLQSLS